MQPDIPHKISVSLALGALSEASEEVERLNDSLAQAKALRDDLIRSAFDSGVPMVRLVRLTGLSREALYKITRKGNIDD